VYERAVAAQQAEEEQVAHAKLQHLSRLRYEAGLAQRQFMRVDPENRLVAAELEKRWEAALAELKRAEEGTANSTPSPSLPPFCLLCPPNFRRPFEPSVSTYLFCGGKE
jgi:hypothetical protein